MSKTSLTTHIVFATKHRDMTITEDYKKDLYAYIHGIVKNKGCHLMRINGIANHLHLLVDIHPSVSVAELVGDIKRWSSVWLKQNPDFPRFIGWGDGYYAVSVSGEAIEACRQYIIGQEQHHSVDDLINEMKHMAAINRIVWHEDDWG